MSQRLLFIAHAPSTNTQAVRDAVVRGAERAEGVTLHLLAPQEATASDVMKADGLILQTTENIGYMAGLTKDFFDRSYNDLLDQRPGLPVVTLIRAGLDGTGTRRALTGIYSGLGWRSVSEMIVLHGAWDETFLSTAQDAGQAMAEGLGAGIF
ncbi:MAG: flavodoxin family protein [Alphaproteobacteria bacterium]